MLAGLSLTPVACARAAGVAAASFAGDENRVADRCRQIEAALGGRLGLRCLDVGSGRGFAYRADERFPLCSTFKWLAVAALLARVDAGHERLDRRVRIAPDDLAAGGAVTKQRVGDDMTMAELCEAAVAQSDNTAANLILRDTGGLAGWNEYVRTLGDRRSRLDRGEPLLNEALPGDARDTTTPAAMVDDLRRVLLGDALTSASREHLTAWMLVTRTSDRRLRAGLPPDWRLADKTGTGFSASGTASDVGVYWPPRGAPLVVAVYVTRATVPVDRQEAAIAELGRRLRDEWSTRQPARSSAQSGTPAS